MKTLTSLLLILAFAAAHAQQKIIWPKHKKAVIVLTYDDAIKSQLNIAAPQLDSAGLKATFFLTGEINSQTIPQWRKLSKEGHELANHTLFHPCSTAEDTPVSSDHYTPYTMIREIDVMNHLLYAVDGQTGPRTYAYPCTETSVGGKDYVDTLKKYGVAKYARIGGGEMEAVISDFAHLDPLKVPSYGLEQGTSAYKLIDFVKKVEEKGGMGIFMFHGVGGDYITTSADAHRALLAYLKQDKNIWITTFQQAMDYVSKQK